MVAFCGPASKIYGFIEEHGEKDARGFLLADGADEGDPERAVEYWEMFKNIDEKLRNPEEEIFSRLKEAGMPEEHIEYVRKEYEQSIGSLVDESTF